MANKIEPVCELPQAPPAYDGRPNSGTIHPPAYRPWTGQLTPPTPQPKSHRRRELEVQAQWIICCNSFQDHSFLLGLFELCLATVFTFILINTISLSTISQLLSLFICTSSACVGALVCINYFYKRKDLSSLYLLIKVLRLGLLATVTVYLHPWIAKSLRVHDNIQPMCVVFILLLTYFFISLAFLSNSHRKYFTKHRDLPPPYEESKIEISNDMKKLTVIYQILMVLIGILEIIFGVAFLILVYRRTIEIIFAYTLLCTLLWVLTMCYGIILVINSVLKKSRICMGYLIFSALRLVIGIIWSVLVGINFLHTHLLANSVREELWDFDIDDFIYYSEVQPGGQLYEKHNKKAESMRASNRKYHEALDKKTQLENKLNVLAQNEYQSESTLLILSALCIIGLLIWMLSCKIYQHLEKIQTLNETYVNVQLAATLNSRNVQ